jgi:hypothetical protein
MVILVMTVLAIRNMQVRFATKILTSDTYSVAHIYIVVTALGRADIARNCPSETLIPLIWAVPWLRRLVAGLPPLSPVFDPGSVHVGFVVDKVAL